MTKRTSSHSANTTTSGAGGPLPTDPLYAYTFEEMAEARKASELRWGDLRYSVWFVWGRVKHVVGIHTFVPLEEWDLSVGSFQIVGQSCWHCKRVIRF